MKWDILLVRKSKNRLNSIILQKKLRKIAESASRNKTLGFEARTEKVGEPYPDADGYIYKVRLRLKKEIIRNHESLPEKVDHIIKVITRCAASEGWGVEVPTHGVSSQPNVQAAAVPVGEQFSEGKCSATNRSRTEQGSMFVVPDLTEAAIQTYFAGIYERDLHIRKVHAAVRTTVETNGAELSHILLYGMPGSCKSRLARAFMGWFNNVREDSFMEVDGTTMSKAGLENWLIELAGADTLPTVLFIDELEKQNPENLFCLHNVMGSGVIAKCNARVGNVRKACPFTVVGTCNDEVKLKERAGALWSRFNHQVYCPRPSRELCEKILLETVAKFPSGNPAWAREALKFGWDVLGQRDIREIKGHLDGRDDLLNGQWQKDELKMRADEVQEKSEISGE